MKYVCTVSDKNYYKYTVVLINSIRASGYDGPIRVFSPDDLDLNCEVIKFDHGFKSNVFPDPRWIKMKLPYLFDEGDVVCFLDADMIAHKWADWDYLLSGENIYAELRPEDDVTHEIQKLKQVLGDADYSRRYLASPACFTVNDEVKNFYKMARAACFCADNLNAGTLLSLNIAMFSCDEFRRNTKLLPRERIVYTLDLNGHIDTYMPFDEPWFVHYGGSRGKTLWHKQHILHEDLGYVSLSSR